MLEPRCLTTLWASMACNRESFTVRTFILLQEQMLSTRFVFTSVESLLSEANYVKLGRLCKHRYSDGLPAGQPRFDSRQGKIFLHSITSKRLWGRPNLVSNGHHGLLSPGLKRPGCEADHSSPSSAEVEKGAAVPPLSPLSSWHST
jgi:hypothetical protein